MYLVLCTVDDGVANTSIRLIIPHEAGKALKSTAIAVQKGLTNPL